MVGFAAAAVRPTDFASGGGDERQQQDAGEKTGCRGADRSTRWA